MLNLGDLSKLGDNNEGSHLLSPYHMQSIVLNALNVFEQGTLICFYKEGTWDTEKLIIQDNMANEL